MNALVPAQDQSIETACRLFAPIMGQLRAGVGEGALRFLSLPDWQVCESTGKATVAALRMKCDAAQAADLIEILIGTRANKPNMPDPEKYIRAVKKVLTNAPPDVAAEAVWNLVQSQKFMAEVSDVKREIRVATEKRESLVVACRAAWKEHQRRATVRQETAEREAERERLKNDPCWQAWQASFARGVHETFDQFQQQWTG